MSLLLFIAGCGGGPTRSRLIKDMAVLDRAYVPVLVFTDLHKQRESEISFGRLKEKWSAFNNRYYQLEFKYGVDIVDKFWKEDFAKINAILATAEGFINEKKLDEAHRELAEMRFVLGKLRHRNGMPYFLDGMNEFDTEMGEILDFLKGRLTLDERDIEKMRNLAVDAREKWSKVMTAEVDAEAFGFDEEKVEAVKKRVKGQDEVLREFEVALWSDDEDSIFQTAQDIQPNFVVLYKAFGDFKPIFEQVVKERK